VLNVSNIMNSARTMGPKSMSKNLASVVKKILETAKSVDCTVDGQDSHDIID
jgi:large subunit ribosomal protein L12e